MPEKGTSLTKYRVFETERFSDDLKLLAKGVVDRIRRKLQDFVYPQLRDEPHHGLNIKRLQNWQPPTWRYRIAEWRFFYEIDDAEGIVFMTAAHHRKDAYR